MFEQLVNWIFVAVGGYLALGLGFAVVFVLRGVRELDPTARERASVGFRLAILPASTVFWPLLLRRWLSGQHEPPEECSPHRCAACSASCEQKDVV